MINTHAFSDSTDFVLLLAQDTGAPIAGRPEANGGQTGAPGGGTGAPATPPPGGGMDFLLIMMAILVGFVLLNVFTSRKQGRQRREMLSSLNRHDRVLTASGIIGTISDIRDDEIVLKVDESTNTKIHVVKSAVQSVLKKSGERAAEPAGTNP